MDEVIVRKPYMDYRDFDKDELEKAIFCYKSELKRHRDEIETLENEIWVREQELSRRAEVERQRDAKTWYEQQQVDARLKGVIND